MFKKYLSVFMSLIILLVTIANPLLSVNAFPAYQEDPPQDFPAEQSSEDGLAAVLDPEGKQVVPDQYIVVMKPTFSVSSHQNEIEASVEAVGGEIKFIFDAVLNGFSAFLPPEALELIRKNENVEYIEPDGIVTISDEDVPTYEEIPNDKLDIQGIQPNATWGLDRIDQRSLPLNNTYYYENVAASVHVYVLDTGLRSTHVEFKNRVRPGFTAVKDGYGTSDRHGHGTHVSGTILGTTYGVAKGALVHPVRVLDASGSGYISWIIAGLNWVGNNRIKPAVGNMSLGAYGNYTSLNDAVRNLINNKGVTVAIAAGNDNNNACYYSPARVPAAITVGSTTSSDYRSSFSNYGDCLDIFAPGSYILSASYACDTCSTTMSGTSMASPHTAGAAAIYLQTHPNATPAAVATFMKSNATKNKVINPGTNSPNNLLYSRTVPPAPTTIFPKISVATHKPTYKWSKVPNAQTYIVQLYQGDIKKFAKLVPISVCGLTECSITPRWILPDGNYEWRVRAKVGGIWRKFSPFEDFNVATEFHYQFILPSSLENWHSAYGPWNLNNGWYRSAGLAPYINSTFHNGLYPTFSYIVRMRRINEQYAANRLFVRGTVHPLDATKSWSKGYLFQYTNNGSYSVWKFINGYPTMIQGWTQTSAINKYGWNKLKVMGRGHLLKFYINGQLVWGGLDSSISHGKVGVGFYKESTNWQPLLIDYAHLYTYVPALSLEDADVWAEIGETNTEWNNPDMSPPAP
jgi:subtilisin family serine protease